MKTVSYTDSTVARRLCPDAVGVDRSAQRKLEEHLRMRPGRIQIRPLGGWPGCLLMILVSVVASVVLTALLNLLVR